MITTKYAKVTGTLPGSKSSALLEKWVQYEADKTGFQAPVAIACGQGAMLEDVDGNRFIDWTSGVLVTNTGHCHPTVVDKVVEATRRMDNVYEYCNEYRVEAAEKLMAVAPDHFGKCFFLSTGSEATDSAVRIMKQATGKYEIISFYGAFHGRVSSTASIGGLKKFKKQIGPGMPGVIRTPYPYCYRCPFNAKKETCGNLCLEFLDNVVEANSFGSLAGLIIEPYLGTAGFIFPPDGWLVQLEQWARNRGILVAADEVQSSFGRTGPMFAIESEGLTPDIMTLGKGMGGGFSVSGLLMTDRIAGALGKGELGSTYGGNPVSCAAVSGVLDAFREENILENVGNVATVFAGNLPALADRFPFVGDVRGRGLVWGIELVEDKQGKIPNGEIARRLVHKCAQKGLLIGLVGAAGNVVRVAPPLVINRDQVLESIEIITDAMSEL